MKNYLKLNLANIFYQFFFCLNYHQFAIEREKLSEVINLSKDTHEIKYESENLKQL